MVTKARMSPQKAPGMETWMSAEDLVALMLPSETPRSGMVIR